MFRFLIYSNVWVALCFSCLVCLGFELREVTFEWAYLLFGFFAVLGVYNLQRWIKLITHDTGSSRDQWLLQRKNPLLLFGLLSLVLSAIFYFNSFYFDWKVIGICSVLTFMYLPPKKLQFLELRKFPIVKLLLVGFVWSILSLPDLLLLEDYWVMASRAIWILAITIPFDLRDIYKDQKDGIRNIASIIGLKRSSMFSSILFLIGFIGELVALYYYPRPFIPVIIIAYFILNSAKRNSKDWYTAGLIESIPAMYFLNYLFTSY